MENNLNFMRIIGGNLKGKKLFFLNTKTTRPLRDIVKESIFNVIFHSYLINAKLKDSKILDLYSGIGSFGLEFISRGASHVSFVENDKKALVLLKKNIENIDIKNKTSLYQKTVNNFINQPDSSLKYDIIFFDPPFADKFFIEELKSVRDKKIYNKNHLIILHRETGTTDEINGVLQTIITKDYGKSKITFGKFS